MRLAVLYDARVHLPAFHALKAWRLAVMASSTSLFHHQVYPSLKTLQIHPDQLSSDKAF